MHLVLASASPRRAELLRLAGYEFDVRPADVDERVAAGETPEEYVLRLAREKSAAGLSAAHHGAALVVLAADTTVVAAGEILAKPDNDDDARRMLRLLSGRPHQVLTGVSVRTAVAELNAVGRTTVWFAELSDDDVDWYVASGEGRDKAGAYAIQGLASRFIPRIDGSYSNVVGLPVALVHDLLTRISGTRPDPARHVRSTAG